jgi:thiol:disulfide interchange protein
MEIVKILATIFLILSLFLVGFFDMDDPKKILNRFDKK